MTGNTILIIDDDVDLCRLLEEYLTTEGFQIEVIHNGESGWQRALEGEFCLIVLDIMLPGINGLEVLRRIRKKSEVPVLMLTARGEEVDRIVGLEIGADDYLSKPFNPRELVARMRSVLRRTSMKQKKSPDTGKVNLIIDDSIQFDIGSRSLSRDGDEIHLTGVEFSILELLVLASGKVVQRENIYTEILDRDYSSIDRSLDVHISNLRKKLGSSTSKPPLITSIRGEGYIFTGSIKEV